MGQKTHPIGFRLGSTRTWCVAVVRDQELRGAAARGREDPPVHQGSALPRGHLAASTSSARPTARASRSSPRGPASSSAARAPRSRSSRTSCRCAPARRSTSTSRRSSIPSWTRSWWPENVALQLQKRVALPPGHEEGGHLRAAPGRRRHPDRAARAGWAAARSRAASGIATGGCRFTRSAPTSTTGWPPPTPRTATIGVKVWIFKGEVLRPASTAGGLGADPMLMPKRVKYRKAQRGPHAGQGPARLDAGLRRVRPEGAGARVGHQPPDRGGPGGAHPQPRSAAARCGSGSSRTSR
mgnify:CR=1 FL=1